MGRSKVGELGLRRRRVWGSVNEKLERIVVTEDLRQLKTFRGTVWERWEKSKWMKLRLIGLEGMDTGWGRGNDP